MVAAKHFDWACGPVHIFWDDVGSAIVQEVDISARITPLSGVDVDHPPVWLPLDLYVWCGVVRAIVGAEGDSEALGFLNQNGDVGLTEFGHFAAIDLPGKQPAIVGGNIDYQVAPLS